MDTKKFKTEIKLKITPVWHKEPPICKISFSNDVFFEEQIKESRIFCYEEFLPHGNYNLNIEFLNKKNSDTINGKDKAIKIDKIIFNTIESKNFIWQGVYQPVYPEPWLSQQKSAGKILKSSLTAQTYLGWNGLWSLTYSVPVFTWIHKVGNHGWIYDQ